MLIRCALLLTSALAFVAAAPVQDKADGKPASEKPKRDEGAGEKIAVFQTITRKLPDGVEMSADVYRLEGAVATTPVLVCMHMTASSRAEYRPYAARMLALGCHLLSVDLRCGGEGERGVRGTAKRVGTPNATWTSAKQVLGREMTYVDAYPDVDQAVAWAKELFPKAPVGLVGSSYSATLALVYAKEHPGAVGVVVALSPGDHVPSWSPVKERIKGIQTPVYITCGNTDADTDHAKPIADAIKDRSKVSTFWPQDEGFTGHHGTMTFAVPEKESREKQWAMFARAIEPLKPTPPKAKPADGPAKQAR